MSAEAELQNRILLRFGREPGVTIWRQNTGVCKSEVCTRAHLERLLSLLSRSQRASEPRASYAVGACYAREARELIRALLEENPRFTPFGLCKGSSDIIGIVHTDCSDGDCICARTPGTCPQLTPGLFIAAEIKAPEPARIKVTDEQAAFLRVVNERGGVGRVVRSEGDMARLISDARSL